MKAVYVKGVGIRKKMRNAITIDEPSEVKDITVRLMMPEFTHEVPNLIKKVARDHSIDADYFGIEIMDVRMASPGSLYDLKVSYYNSSSK